MSNIYDQFNNAFDTEQLKKDAAEVATNDGKKEYPEVPCGEYEVSISHLELKASKAGNPMVSCRCKILAGDYKNQIIFYNQVVKEKYGLHNAKKFLASMDSGIEVTFDNFTQFGNMIEDIADEIKNAEYALKYFEGKNGYKGCEILKRF